METTDKCKYCNTETAIKCLDCGEYFCNCMTSDKSHVIFHLVKSRHKRVSIMDREMECVECKENNLFRLGLSEKVSIDSRILEQLKQLKIENPEESEDQCDKKDNSNTVESSNKEDGEIKKNENEKQNEIIGILSNIYCGHCRDLPKVVKNKFISFYPTGTSNFDAKSLKESVGTPKPRLYFTPETYLNTFIPLINAESNKEREIKENMRQEDVTLLIDGGYCRFTVLRSNSDFKVNIGDELRFLHKGKVLFKGYVCEEQFSDVIRVRIDCTFIDKDWKLDDKDISETLAKLPRSGYTIEFIWNPTTYKRMCNALQVLYKERETSEIFKYILRGTKETASEIEVLQPSKLCPLNSSQEIAVKAALTRKLTLIQGPPGTGKTMVSATIVYNLVKHYGKKVMVVAPSNTAADQLAIKINSTGIKVLRVMSKRREDMSCDVDFLSLHRLVSHFPESGRTEAQRRLVEMTDVVCCTCISAGQKIFKGASFPFVLIDEAVQSTEPLSLVPCVYGAKRLILVGDHKQLGPTILNKEVVKHGFKQSLFERLLRIGVKPYLLSVQYRMHPDLCAFPSEYFYGGLLKSDTPTARVLDLPNNFFYVCEGKEEISQSRTSFFNKSEAIIVENIIRYLFKNGVVEQQIGVITPYEGQRSYILGQIFGNEAGNLEIKNVDGFQGREKDFIIVSLVRSNMFQGIGFVGDKRRMNVTLTRAKHGLIIIGNPFTLCKNELWEDLLSWYDRQGQVYEGPLNMLRPLSLKQLNLRGEAE